MVNRPCLLQLHELKSLITITEMEFKKYINKLLTSFMKFQELQQNF